MTLKWFRVFHAKTTALSTPITSEQEIGIKETHYGVCLQHGTISHLVKNLLLPRLFDKLDMQDPQENA
ncbi:hypothetical protein ACQP3C_25180 [Escherichia coli]